VTLLMRCTSADNDGDLQRHLQCDGQADSCVGGGSGIAEAGSIGAGMPEYLLS
jgi:hypothetical protein